MLSVAAKRPMPNSACSVSISLSTRGADLALNAMPSPFRPQNVQWCFCPHQQPREDSNGIEGRTRAASDIEGSCAK